MEDKIVIDVRDVEKGFKVFFDKGQSLKERLLFKKRSRYENRKVLNGISLQVKKGEAIGLIGHNGCGKSTLLKMLTKIMYPDKGTIEISGRVSSLIELGAGFHPDMSGRENIYINASIFGLSKQEIDSRLDDIIAFSELEEFIDNPVRTYSSGMYMRLAFSVAINVDADVLLIDEILAVGDVTFQAKCFNKLKEIKAAGTTIVIVSHSLGQIEQICERSVWIHDGLIKAEGNPKEIHMEYLDFMEGCALRAAEEQNNGPEPEPVEEAPAETPEANEETVEEAPAPVSEKRWGNRKAEITNIRIFNAEGKISNVFRTGDNIVIRLDYKVSTPVEDAVFGIGIFGIDGTQCYGTNTRIDKLERFDLSKKGVVELKLEKCNLLPGKYLLDFAIESENGIPVDYFREAAAIEFISHIGDVGVARIEHSWQI